MFRYIKQSFLPRDITVLPGTAIGGVWPRRPAISFFSSPSSDLLQLLCPRATKGTLALMLGVDSYHSTHPSSRGLTVLTGSLENICPSNNIASFPCLPGHIPLPSSQTDSLRRWSPFLFSPFFPLLRVLGVTCYLLK